MNKTLFPLFLAYGLALSGCSNKDNATTETGAASPSSSAEASSIPITATLMDEKTKAYCDCLDKQTLSYLASHPNLKATEVSDAKLIIGTPCYDQFQQFENSLSKTELEKFDETKEGRKLISSRLTCSYSIEAKLMKTAK